jgi:hypothetical protein
LTDIESMMGKEVEVIANGVSYRGVLVEVSETEVSLKSMMQWISLPVSSVITVRLAGQERREHEREGILSRENEPI